MNYGVMIIVAKWWPMSNFVVHKMRAPNFNIMVKVIQTLKIDATKVPWTKFWIDFCPSWPTFEGNFVASAHTKFVGLTLGIFLWIKWGESWMDVNDATNLRQQSQLLRRKCEIRGQTLVLRPPDQVLGMNSWQGVKEYGRDVWWTP